MPLLEEEDTNNRQILDENQLLKLEKLFKLIALGVWLAGLGSFITLIVFGRNN